MRSQTGNSAKNAGFTIVEVMIVVVIIGIVASIAASNFSDIQRRASLESSFRNTKLAFHRCRAEGLNAGSGTSAVPTSTALVLFTNGYACISWDDADANQLLGSGAKIDLAGGDILAPGHANGEVLAVYFQDTYDERYPVNAELGLGTDPDVFLAEGQSTLQPVGHGQSADTGYVFVVAPGGFYQTPARTTMVSRVELQQPLNVNGLFNDPNYHPGRFCLFPSGQATEPIQVPGAC